MKTATITWVTYLNFGTYLQSFALQTFLRKKGVDNVIIDDYAHTSIAYHNSKSKLLSFMRLIKRHIMFLFNPGIKSTHKLYKSFKEEFLDIDYCSTDYTRLNEKYDVFICGSDQIWNPLNEYPGKDYYYATFSSKKKVAYAPSLGESYISEDNIKVLRERIMGFHALSGREWNGCEILGRISDGPVVKVIDPTLLLSKQDYYNIIKSQERFQEKKYVVVYLLTWNSKYYEYAQNYAKKNNIELIYLNLLNADAKQIKGGIYLGPIEFLHAIRDAEFVFTDSFHGSIFSLIFETQFMTFMRFVNNKESQNSRVKDFHTMFGTEDHLVNVDNLPTDSKLSNIDFKKAKEKLRRYQEESGSFLLNAILK